MMPNLRGGSGHGNSNKKEGTDDEKPSSSSEQKVPNNQHAAYINHQQQQQQQLEFKKSYGGDNSGSKNSGDAAYLSLKEKKLNHRNEFRQAMLRRGIFNC